MPILGLLTRFVARRGHRPRRSARASPRSPRPRPRTSCRRPRRTFELTADTGDEVVAFGLTAIPDADAGRPPGAARRRRRSSSSPSPSRAPGPTTGSHAARLAAPDRLPAGAADHPVRRRAARQRELHDGLGRDAGPARLRDRDDRLAAAGAPAGPGGRDLARRPPGRHREAGASPSARARSRRSSCGRSSTPAPEPWSRSTTARSRSRCASSRLHRRPRHLPRRVPAGRRRRPRRLLRHRPAGADVGRLPGRLVAGRRRRSRRLGLRRRLRVHGWAFPGGKTPANPPALPPSAFPAASLAPGATPTPTPVPGATPTPLPSSPPLPSRRPVAGPAAVRRRAAGGPARLPGSRTGAASSRAGSS